VSPHSPDLQHDHGSGVDPNQSKLLQNGRLDSAIDPNQAPTLASVADDDDEYLAVTAGQHAYESLIQLCRKDVNAFAEFVLRDEETKEPIEQAKIHVEMQAAYDRERFIKVLAHPESGKTQQLVICRTLFELGNDATERHVFLNNGQDGAKKSLGAVKKYIEKSKELRAVFPKLLPGNLWREDAIVVEGAGMSRDPSIYCLGFHGNITGARIDRAKVDDLLDYENTRTPEARKDVDSWFRRTFLSRLTGRSTLAFLTNAWHEEDLGFTLSEDGWFSLHYPVLDDSGQPTWPERWDLPRIALWRRRLGELEFARSFLCEPRDAGAMSFRPEWLRGALRRGVGYAFVDNLAEAPSNALIVTGSDIGASKKLRGGASTLFTVCVYPNGMRQLIAARSGRWSGGEFMANLVDVGERYGGVIVVEDNGVQKHLVDLANEDGTAIPVPVLPFYTGRNKYDVTLGIDALGAEFESNRWIFPSGRSGRDIPEEVRRLMGECRAYSPGTHPGDRLMALWFARTWALRRLRGLQSGRQPGAKVRAMTFG
jgi:hypothetical protein